MTNLRIAIAFGVLTTFLGPVCSVRAQAPAPAATPAPDPAFEAARRSFEALGEADRRAIQEGLIWTGDYKGVVDGGFGRGTRAAIVSFAQRSGLPGDGTLDPKGRAMLAAAANLAKGAVGFTTLRDPRTGTMVGVAGKLLTRRIDTASGSRWVSSDGALSLETEQGRESAADLIARFDQLKDTTPARRVTYKLLRPDFLVVTGDTGKSVFYTRLSRGVVDGVAILRGYTFTYPAGVKTFDAVSVALASAFDAFPGAAPGAAAPTAPTASATGQRPPAAPLPAVSGGVSSAPPVGPALAATAILVEPGKALSVLRNCQNPMIGGKPVTIARTDEATGLSLLTGLQGAQARPLAIVAKAMDEDLLVLFERARAPAPGTLPGADLAATVGQGLAPASAGKPGRMLAALPDETPGAPVFDRSGEWIAMAGAGGHAMNLGGVTLQSVWPVIGGEDIARFLVASGIVPSARPAATGTASASAIAASANAALLSVSCTR